MEKIYQKGTRARIGDLAIARFDADPSGHYPVGNDKNFEEHVCLVTGNKRRFSECEFIWWDKSGNRTEMITGSLPHSRVIRVKPKKKWDGVLVSLALDDVSII